MGRLRGDREGHGPPLPSPQAPPETGDRVGAGLRRAVADRPRASGHLALTQGAPLGDC